jgi:hypothetical protein
VRVTRPCPMSSLYAGSVDETCYGNYSYTPSPSLIILEKNSISTCDRLTCLTLRNLDKDKQVERETDINQNCYFNVLSLQSK